MARARKPRAPAPVRKSAKSDRPEGLTEQQHAFCLAYLANGYKAGTAYAASHPGVSKAAAYVNGHRMLKVAKVARFLSAELRPMWEALEVSAAESTARLAGLIRADIRHLHDREGHLRPMWQWPDDAALAVNAIEHRADGSVKLKLTDRLASLRTALELAGKLRGNDAGLKDLAALLAEKWKPGDGSGGGGTDGSSE